MSASSPLQPASMGEDALRRLHDCEEVLQICYWLQGEGLGERFTPDAVLTFLNSSRASVAEIFEILAGQGDLERTAATYRFSAEGKKKAGRLFYENFTDFQLGSHGECNAGCGDSEEECDHDQGQPIGPVHDRRNHEASG